MSFKKLYVSTEIYEMSLPCEEFNAQPEIIDISEVIYSTLAQVQSMPKTQEVDIDKQFLAETVTRDTVNQI
jgi:hypothetical protein